MMKKILVLLGVILISTACSNATTQSLEDRAIELCKEHGGFKPGSDYKAPDLERKAVCGDSTTVNL